MEYRDVDKKICENVRCIRVNRKKTQKEIAEQLEISLSAYQKLEQGSRTFSTQHLYRLAKIYDVNIDFFYSDYFKMWECFSEEALIYDGYNLTEKSKKNLLKHVLEALEIDVKEKDISALVNWLRKYNFQYFYSSPLLKLYNQRRSELLFYLKNFEENIGDNLPDYERRLYELEKQYKELSGLILESERKYQDKMESLYVLDDKIKERKKQLLNDEIKVKDDRLRKLNLDLNFTGKLCRSSKNYLEKLKIKIRELEDIVAVKEKIISSEIYSKLGGDEAQKYIDLETYTEKCNGFLSELDKAYEKQDEEADEIDYLKSVIEDYKAEISELEREIEELKEIRIDKEQQIIGDYTIVDINVMEVTLHEYYKQFGNVRVNRELLAFASTLDNLVDDIPGITRYTKWLSDKIFENPYD